MGPRASGLESPRALGGDHNLAENNDSEGTGLPRISFSDVSVPEMTGCPQKSNLVEEVNDVRIAGGKSVRVSFPFAELGCFAFRFIDFG